MLSFVKLVSFLFFLIPDCLVMGLAVVLSPVFYNAMLKEKWGFKIRRILPKVFKERTEKWYNRIIRKNSVHLMKFAGEMLKAHYKLDFFLKKKCYIAEGREYLEELIINKTGFMIITCHLGNWEYAAAWLAMEYGEIYAPVFVENSVGNKALNWIRTGHRVNMLEASYDPIVSARSLIKMMKLLENGEIIFIVSDQEALGGDYKGKLFGKEIRVFGGPFILGQKTGKPLLPMYTIRNSLNKIELHFEAPFYINGKNREKDISKLTDFFERNISKYPDQYLWSQDRW